MTDSYLYDSFGNMLLTSGSTTNWFRYDGREGYLLDGDLEPYFLRARFYNPPTARFLSREPGWIGLRRREPILLRTESTLRAH